MTPKTFDALEMTRRIRDTHAAQLQDVSAAERIAFYRTKAQMMRTRAEAVLCAKRDEQGLIVPHNSQQ